MGRQPLWRRVGFMPQVFYFKPHGVPMIDLQEVGLCIEEVEAIRLKDMEGMDQAECARKMNISRTTFSRVLSSARQKVADALLNGKAVKIEGGNFEMASRRFRCLNNHEWEVPFEVMINEPPRSCPTCNTESIMPIFPKGDGRFNRGRGGRHRGGHQP